MKAEVARFVEEMLSLIRRDFYLQSEKRFCQERRTLIQAITWPADYMNRRGVQMPASGYRRILVTVVDTIKRHGTQLRFRRFSLYLFKSVQEHMNHHGDEYYYAAKMRPVSDVLPDVTRHVRQGAATDQATELMAQLNRIVRSPGGRRRRDSAADSGDLFSHCKGPAGGQQKRRNHSQTFAVSPAEAPEILKPRTRSARDS